MEINTKLTPEGFAAVRTYLAVSDVPRQIDFLHKVFKAAIKENLKTPEGDIVHGELVIGDSIIMVGRATAEVKPIQGMCYVYVSDVDEVFKRAIENRAVPISEPADQVYGNREGGFKDQEGNTWWVSQFLKSVSTEEIEREMSKMKLR